MSAGARRRQDGGYASDPTAPTPARAAGRRRQDGAAVERQLDDARIEAAEREPSAARQRTAASAGSPPAGPTRPAAISSKPTTPGRGAAAGSRRDRPDRVRLHLGAGHQLALAARRGGCTSCSGAPSRPPPRCGRGSAGLNLPFTTCEKETVSERAGDPREVDPGRPPTSNPDRSTGRPRPPAGARTVSSRLSGRRTCAGDRGPPRCSPGGRPARASTSSPPRMFVAPFSLTSVVPSTTGRAASTESASALSSSGSVASVNCTSRRSPSRRPSSAGRRPWRAASAGTATAHRARRR